MAGSASTRRTSRAATRRRARTRSPTRRHYGGQLDVPITDALDLDGEGGLAAPGRRARDPRRGGRPRLPAHRAAGASAPACATTSARTTRPSWSSTQEEGERTDAVAQIGFDAKGRWKAYTFGQGTLVKSGDRDANNRGGVGGAFRINDRLLLEGETSYGNLGPAVRIGTSFQQSEETRRYLSYAFENERGYDGLHERRGNLISGMRTRLSDSSERLPRGPLPARRLDDGPRARDGHQPRADAIAGADRATGSSEPCSTAQTNAETEAPRRRRAASATGSTGSSSRAASSTASTTASSSTARGLDRTTWLFRNTAALPADAGRCASSASTTTPSATARSATSSTAASRRRVLGTRLPARELRPAQRAREVHLLLQLPDRRPGRP